MYYHNSPTTKQLKALKRAKAVEMKQHLNNMQLVTSKYETTIRTLEQLRTQELLVENEMSTNRLSKEQLDDAHDILKRNRRKASKLVLELLPDFTIEEN